MNSVNNIILVRINSINASTVARNIIYANVIDANANREWLAAINAATSIENSAAA